jgi:hypothetical protein
MGRRLHHYGRRCPYRAADIDAWRRIGGDSRVWPAYCNESPSRRGASRSGGAPSSGRKSPAELTNGYFHFTDDLTLSLKTNGEAFAVNQRSSNARELRSGKGQVVWTSDLPEPNTKIATLFKLDDDGN